MKVPGSAAKRLNTPHQVETCNSTWERRSVHPSRAEAYAEMARLIKEEHWGTASIRVQPCARLQVVK